MKYVIDKLSDLEIIKVTVSGTLNQEIREKLHPKVISELNANGYHRLLIDLIDSKVSENHTTRTINTFARIEAIKKIEKKNNLKTAVLSRDRDDNRKYFMKLAQVIGGLNTKLFSNYDEAITWLLGGKDIFN
jgi:hypothetical protein